MKQLFDNVHSCYEFDEELEYLAELIGMVDRPGDYFVHSRVLTPMPRLEVGNSGLLSFPIPSEQLRSLITEAARAPYGKGEQTVIDSSVRDCWQIASDEIRLGGAWEETLEEILHFSASGLGLAKGAFAAALYKMLIYEKGGFFKPHRDTEKAEGMVATLVIVLPTAGAGGDLVIRHKGREVVIDMRTDDPSELVFAAFYADCEHEVEPIVEGYRVCLVYNLILEEGRPMVAPDSRKHEITIAAEMERINRHHRGGPRFVWVLEHDYSEAGLSFDTLKNADASVAHVLKAAGDRSGFDLHAAILCYEDSGPLDVDDIGISDIYDCRCWLENFVRPDREKVDYGELKLGTYELMPPSRMENDKVDWAQLNLPTGNDGVSFERSYRRAAFVLWPKGERLNAFAGSAPDAILALASHERELAESSKRIKEVASQLVDVWPIDSWKSNSEKTLQALTLLCEMDQADAISKFVNQVVLPKYEEALNPGIETAVQKMETERVGVFLSELARIHLSWSPEGIMRLIFRLHERFGKPVGDGPWASALRAAMAVMCEQIPNVGRPPENDQSGISHLDVESLSADFLNNLFDLGRSYDLTVEMTEAAESIILRPGLVSPNRAIPGLLNSWWRDREDDAKRSDAFDVLWRQSAKFLLERSGASPEPPTNWKLPTDKLDCACEHCQELRKFCVDPKAQTYRFTLGTGPRTHLCHQIDFGKIDLSYEVERKGRPFTLVCYKTRDSYERRLEEYSEDIVQLRHLSRMADAVPDSAETKERLGAAIVRSG